MTWQMYTPCNKHSNQSVGHLFRKFSLAHLQSASLLPLMSPGHLWFLSYRLVLPVAGFHTNGSCSRHLWFLLHRVMSEICSYRCINGSCRFIATFDPTSWIYSDLLIHLSVDGHFGRFQFLAIVNASAVSIVMQMFQTCAHFCCLNTWERNCKVIG